MHCETEGSRAPGGRAAKTNTANHGHHEGAIKNHDAPLGSGYPGLRAVTHQVPRAAQGGVAEHWHKRAVQANNRGQARQPRVRHRLRHDERSDRHACQYIGLRTPSNPLRGEAPKCANRASLSQFFWCSPEAAVQALESSLRAATVQTVRQTQNGREHRRSSRLASLRRRSRCRQ